MDHDVACIPWDALEVGEMIGQGGFGSVHLGTWHHSPVAIKQLHLRTLSAELLQEFLHEATIMAKCQFDNVVRLYGIVAEAGHYSMVMEFMNKGSLHSFLMSKSAFPWPQRFKVAIGLAKGLSYLHDKKILHRDLKSQNVLLDDQLNAKICDFGLAHVKLESSNSNSTNQRGTIRWRSPESFKRGFKPHSSSDVYSFGMVLWEIATRKIPFAEEPNELTVISWIRDGEQETIPLSCDPVFSKIIKMTWSQPDDRPPAHQITKILISSTPSDEPKSWHIDPSTPIKDPSAIYELVDATEKDVKKTISLFQSHPVPGYEIASVKTIFNKLFDSDFKNQLTKFQQKQGNPAFVPQWNSKSNPTWRAKTLQLLTDFSRDFTDTDFPDVTLVPAWHGTNPATLHSIFTTGYANIATTDSGFFGKGIYSALEADYAHRVYSKGALILNWVCAFLVFPVIDGDMSLLEGKGNYSNYDAHFAPVVPFNPNNPKEVNYIPCKLGQANKFSEIVVFQSTACLPRYLVELQPTLPKSLSSSAEIPPPRPTGSLASQSSSASPAPPHPAFSKSLSLGNLQGTMNTPPPRPTGSLTQSAEIAAPPRPPCPNPLVKAA